MIALVSGSAMAIPNPLRALAPSVFGLTCDAHRLCIDDVRRLPHARELALSAMADVRDKLGEFESHPKMIFCSSEECFGLFGKRRSTAAAFGSQAVLIGPRGWEMHFVRHELIHVAQYQRLGLVRAWRAPKWLIEGMAYSLSEDPRRPLPGDLEALRAQFERSFGDERGAALWDKLQAAADI
jgi:hypothetical protein